MSALQHGLPVLTTDGHFTDDRLRKSGALDLVSAGDIVAFATAAARIAQDPAWRIARGAAAAALYRREFDWPVIATRLQAGLGAEHGALNALASHDG